MGGIHHLLGGEGGTARRLQRMEDDNRQARQFARRWIAVSTLMNLGMAVSGVSGSVIKPAM